MGSRTPLHTKKEELSSFSKSFSKSSFLRDPRFLKRFLRSPKLSLLLSAALSLPSTAEPRLRVTRPSSREREKEGRRAFSFDFLRPGVVNREGRKKERKKKLEGAMSARWRTLARALGPVASSSSSGGAIASLSQAQVRFLWRAGDEEFFLPVAVGSSVGGRQKEALEPPVSSRLAASPSSVFFSPRAHAYKLSCFISLTDQQ